MSWALSTDDALTALRTAIGTSLTVSETTLTWQKLVEGHPLRWLSEAADYPLIIFQPEDTDATDGAARIGLDLLVTVHVCIQTTSGGSIAPAHYKACRTVGEGVVAKIMDAGHRLGTDWLARRLVSCGVDYDTTEQFADHGLLVYRAQFALGYQEAEIR